MYWKLNDNFREFFGNLIRAFGAENAGFMELLAAHDKKIIAINSGELTMIYLDNLSQYRQNAREQQAAL